MTTLSSEIEQYYFNNLSKLPKDKQFHFATRLAAWSQNTQATHLLTTQIDDIYPKDIYHTLTEIVSHPPQAKINALELRQPYFEKYPDLRGQMLALFRIRHLLSVYDIDIRDDMLHIVPLDELQKLSNSLFNDENAVRILSTYAVNYIYLVQHILYPTKDAEDFIKNFTAAVYDMDKHYDLSQKEDIQLLIYLYTHCIIGHTNFYKESIKLTSFPVYAQMIERLEQLIEENFNRVNLDNKFEFLVCSRIIGRVSKLNEAIVNEASQSLSPEGMFVIDTINEYKQSNKTSFSDSEHRNVLFIMSQRPYHS
jgi:hypothetical protein